MNEWNEQSLENNRPQSAEPPSEQSMQSPAEPFAEQSMQPPAEPFAEPAAEQPMQPSARPAGQSQWQGGARSQGGYTYQNPNPYQPLGGYQNYTQPPKKKSNLAVILVATVAAGTMLLCCVAIVLAMVFGLTGQVIYNDNENAAPEVGAPVEKEEETEEIKDSQRQEGAVYNMPEISTAEKTGEALSIVEINKKVKNSVVGVLIAERAEDEPVFSGSGFIISQDGYIMTNSHVISGAAQVRVVLSDGITEYVAVIVGEDERSDLAILKVEATGLQAAELGNSDTLEVGEEVVAIGNPYGMELAGTVTNGIISALNRKIEMNGSFMTLIQTNASINPGNSGGPLVNAYGQIIGITSSKLVATDFEGIGFAIPINHATDITTELISYGYIKTRAYIGISGSELTAAYAEYHDLPRGVYVSYVDPECDAAKKGLKVDDIIIGFNGKEILTMAELNDLKDSFHPGDTVTVRVWRDGKEFDISITLTEATQ
ncbi:MAG: trypsin-like peptidase domain-containing protein [Clostridia bacterium]|nr:trypsin-like peptidase domain-containing protein [Clostridia bacterium]